jgi:hypothetical protein
VTGSAGLEREQRLFGLQPRSRLLDPFAPRKSRDRRLTHMYSPGGLFMSRTKIGRSLIGSLIVFAFVISVSTAGAEQPSTEPTVPAANSNPRAETHEGFKKAIKQHGEPRVREVLRGLGDCADVHELYYAVNFGPGCLPKVTAALKSLGVEL